MFGDAAKGWLGFNKLAHLNPLRWSGPVGFEKAINDLEEVQKVDGSRPVLVKVPAGVTTAHQRFGTVQEAIAYLKTKDPAELKRQQVVENVVSAFKQEAEKAELARKQEADKNAREALQEASRNKDAAEVAVSAASEEVDTNEDMVRQAKAEDKAANETAYSAKMHADAVQSELNCSWKFADRGKELLGFSVAKLNPWRYSEDLSLEEGILQLRTVQAQAPDSPIVVKVPGGDTGTRNKFQTASEAMAFLERACPLKNKAQQALEAANEEQKTAKARLSDAEAAFMDAQAKLQLAKNDLSSAETRLEDAQKIAAQAKAELDEMSSAP